MFSSSAAAEFAPLGQQQYTSPGSYSFVCPGGVRSISVVCVGGGEGGGARYGGDGGNLRYVNNIVVTPGETLTVSVGAGGAGSTSTSSGAGNNGGDSYLERSGTKLCLASGGASATTDVGTGGDGGLGGTGLAVIGTYGTVYNGGGGGGAGGYSGNGGNGGDSASPTAGSGGGGGGGGCDTSAAREDTVTGFSYGSSSSSGGGVGLLGEGSNGTAGTNATTEIGGGGGSGGTAGTSSAAGVYGAGGTGGYTATSAGTNFAGDSGASGAVRIIWGPDRAFPSTNTADV